jgi:flagellar motor switch protein FliN/FliY
MMSEGSDGSLSQDEIDALLQGTGGMDFEEPSPVSSESLDNSQLQAFAGLMNSTVETQASNLTMLVSKSVSIGIPQVDQVNSSMIAEGMSFDLVHIRVNFKSGVTGEHGYILPSEVALAIASPMMGLDGVELNDAAINALDEAVSNLTGPVMTVLGEKCGKTIMNDAPTGSMSNVTDLGLPLGNLVRVVYPLTIDSARVGTFIEYYTVPFVQAVTGQAGGAKPAAGKPAQQNMGGQMGGMNQMMGNMGMQQPMMGMPQQMMGMGQMGMPQQMMGNMGGMMGQMGGQVMGTPQNIQSVQFPAFGQGVPGMEQGNIGLLMDVYMEVTVELGRTKKLIREILGMGEGTIIELDKLAGEPVDILVNHKLIAKGEVVVIDENFGVRVTEIVSPVERMNNMQ